MGLTVGGTWYPQHRNEIFALTGVYVLLVLKPNSEYTGQKLTNPVINGTRPMAPSQLLAITPQAITASPAAMRRFLSIPPTLTFILNLVFSEFWGFIIETCKMFCQWQSYTGLEKAGWQTDWKILVHSEFLTSKWGLSFQAIDFHLEWGCTWFC